MFKTYREEVSRIKDDDSLDYDEKRDSLFLYNISYAFMLLLDTIFVKPFQILGWIIKNIDEIMGTALVLYGISLIFIIIYVALP